MSTKTKWTPKTKTPRKRGWYITRTKQGDVQWRCWGCGAWWKQIKGGWVEWFDGNGEAVTYDFQPDSHQPVELDSHQLPAIAEAAP